MTGPVEGGSLARVAQQLAGMTQTQGGIAPNREPILSKFYELLANPENRELLAALDRHEEAVKSEQSLGLKAWFMNNLGSLGKFLARFFDETSGTQKAVQDILDNLPPPPPFPSAQDAIQFCKNALPAFEALNKLTENISTIQKFEKEEMAKLKESVTKFERSEEAREASMEARRVAKQDRRAAFGVRSDAAAVAERHGSTPLGRTTPQFRRAQEDFCLANLQYLKVSENPPLGIDMYIRRMEAYIEQRDAARTNPDVVVTRSPDIERLMKQYGNYNQ